jgi:hypothetical protein
VFGVRDTADKSQSINFREMSACVLFS